MEFWIARDTDGGLWLFDKKPILRNGTNCSWFDMDDVGIFNYRLYDDWFPEVTFDNSPKRVEMKLVKE